jgi:hypothetical protein
MTCEGVQDEGHLLARPENILISWATISRSRRPCIVVFVSLLEVSGGACAPA